MKADTVDLWETTGSVPLAIAAVGELPMTLSVHVQRSKSIRGGQALVLVESARGPFSFAGRMTVTDARELAMLLAAAANRAAAVDRNSFLDRLAQGGVI